MRIGSGLFGGVLIDDCSLFNRCRAELREEILWRDWSSPQQRAVSPPSLNFERCH